MSEEAPMDYGPDAPPPATAPGAGVDALADFMSSMVQRMEQLEISQHNASVYLQRQQPVHDPSSSNSRLKPKTPDTYNGSPTIPVRSWIFQQLTYIRARAETNPASIILFLVSQLRGNAAMWWEAMESSNMAAEITTVEQFTEALVQQFQPINPVQVARDDLAVIRQLPNMSIQDYVASFHNVALRIPSLSEDEQVDRFIRGLTNTRVQAEIFRHMSVSDDLSFSTIVQLAERVDAGLRRAATFGRSPTLPGPSRPQRRVDFWPRGRNNFAAPPSMQPVPMELGNVNAQRAPALSREARQRLINEGRCFYCKEHGHRALECPKRNRSGNGRSQ